MPATCQTVIASLQQPIAHGRHVYLSRFSHLILRWDREIGREGDSPGFCLACLYALAVKQREIEGGKEIVRWERNTEAGMHDFCAL